MSPEQIEGRTAGPAADVFAFGVLMYEWISGTPSVSGGIGAGDARARARQHARAAVEPRARAAVAVGRHRSLPAQAGERAVRLRQQSCCRRSIIPRSRRRRQRRSSTWWRTHQLVAIVLYMIASAHAWQIKEWLREPISLWVFVVDRHRRLGRRHHSRPSGVHRRHEPAAPHERARAHEAREAVHRRADGPAAGGRRAAAHQHRAADRGADDRARHRHRAGGAC